MKGISHFTSGVAVASFFPWAVQAAEDGNPLFFILGGAFGLLPDTLDFKFYRFFYRHDMYIEPDPNNLDPQQIADQISHAIKQAADTNKTIRIKLSTIRLGVDYWQQYSVKFDTEAQQVVVSLGPVVNTGQVPVPSEPKETVEGTARLPAAIIQTYDATTKVDIFDGPTMSFEPDKSGSVILHFLPWHRNWSHSILVGLFFGLIGTAIWSWQAGAVIATGYSIHILEDQLGFMGSNLFFPVTKIRFPGMHLMRSGDAFPNFGTVWLCCLLIFWNLYRHMETPLYTFNFFQLITFGAILPIGLFAAVLIWLDRRQTQKNEDLELSDEWDMPSSM